MTLTTNPPPQIVWDQVLVRRTVDRRPGVVIAEEIVHDLTSEEQTRKLLGQIPKEVLTVFFYWDGDRVSPSLNVVKATKGRSQYLSITNDLCNMYGNDHKLIPWSTYRKNVGEGIRAITYGAHTSLVASDRSGKFITNVTSAVGHEVCLFKCHKLATLMPEKIPYLIITVVLLTNGDHCFHIKMFKIIDFSDMSLLHLVTGQGEFYKLKKRNLGRSRFS